MAILETRRLYLRKLQQSDFAALCCILQDPAVMYAYEGAFTDEEVQAWLVRQQEREGEKGLSLWALIEKESDRMVGQCGLTMQPWRERTLLEIGYLLQKTVWHRGYATEAAAACRDYAFSKLGAPEVFSMIRENNLPSQAVAKRLGMQVVDRASKHYRGVDMPHLLFSRKPDL